MRGQLKRTASSTSPASARPPYSSTMFTTAAWPHHVANMRANYNPTVIRLPYVSDYGRCACSDPCRFASCRNTQLGIFCAATCCPYSGMCGNGLEATDAFAIVQRTGAMTLCIVVTDGIDARRVVDQLSKQWVHASHVSGAGGTQRRTRTHRRGEVRQRDALPEPLLLTGTQLSRDGKRNQTRSRDDHLPVCHAG
ncbi:hypothetical protein PybrP1_009914 [[Pythium] brassicae (nom. inval.)]|nr:hypothetical protein PybrP1_009914 [[Pythium] brassicae (nom. inval.)]